MKNLFEISSEEKNRILGLHENATKNQYLISEQNKLRGPGVKDVTDTTTTSYSKDISDFFPSGQYESEKVKNLISSVKPKSEEFIKKAKLTHGDKYDYSISTYTLSKNKIKIIFKSHCEFEQQSRKH
jgi:hypothetical protein